MGAQPVRKLCRPGGFPANPGFGQTEAELDEENGGPIWEMEFVRAGREGEVDVDADTGAILGDD